MNDKSHLTAISRTKPSSPAQYLYSKGRISGKCLDYGCGKGIDADTYGMDRYDPYYHNIKPQAEQAGYDTILCTYVLNVVNENEQKDILVDIKYLLKIFGIAYITVRRDIKQDYISSKGTLQRYVELDLPVMYKCSDYIIYKMYKSTDLSRISVEKS